MLLKESSLVSDNSLDIGCSHSNMVKNKVAPWVAAVPGGQNAPKLTGQAAPDILSKDFDIKIKEFYTKHRREIILCVYCSYLAVISLTTTQAHGSGDSIFISTAAITNMFSGHRDLANYSEWPISPNYPRSYLDVGNFGDFFDWLPSLELYLLRQEYYNGDPLEIGSVSYTFVLLGNITIRQVRVSSSSCTVLPSFQNLINSSECFGNLGFSGDSRDTFVTANGKSYIWRDSDLLRTARYFGQYDSYPGGGYLVVLPTDPIEFKEKVNELMDARWLDLGTRAVFIDLLLYNPASMLVSEVKVIFESPFTGGLFPFLDIKSARYSDLFFNSDTIAELGLQVSLLVLTLGYLLSELLSWYQIGSRCYWSAQGDQSWVYFEWMKHACVITGFVFKFWAYSFTQYGGLFPPPKGQTTNLGIAMTYLMYWRVLLSFGVLSAWIQMLQFMGHLSSVKLFVSTCVKCLPAVLPFVISYLILTAGTSFAFCLIFSDSMYTAKSLSFSFMFTFVSFVSGYDLTQMYSIDRVMGPVLHIFWFFVASVLANNFIVALIMAKMEEEQKNVGPTVSILEHMQKIYDQFAPPAVSESEIVECAVILIQSVVRGHFGRQLAAEAAESLLEDEQAAAAYSRAKKAESRSRLLAIGSDLERIKAMSDSKAVKQLTARVDELSARVHVAGSALASIDAGKHALIYQISQLQQVFDKLASTAEGAVVSSQRKIIQE
jgi:hypothetical protein